MKQVLKEIPAPFVGIATVSEDKYYGVVKGIKTKGFVTQEQYKEGNFIVMSLIGLTYHNWYDASTKPTLQGLITYLIETYKDQVYEFDTPQELFKWLSE